MTDVPSDGDGDGIEIALSRRSHERLGHRRTDEAWLAQQWAAPETRVLVLAGGRFPVDEHEDRAEVHWLSPAEADAVAGEGERVLLGLREDVVHFALIPGELRAPDDWGMLRSHGPRLPARDRALLVQAQALAEWYR